MIAKKSLYLVAISLLMITTSCSRNDRIEPPKKDNSGKKWADMTNVDVSDTDKNVSSKESSDLRKEIISRPPFPATEYNRLALKGNGTVTGVIYLDDGVREGRFMVRIHGSTSIPSQATLVNGTMIVILKGINLPKPIQDSTTT